MREHATRFATIPCLIALDVTGCGRRMILDVRIELDCDLDLDNELSTLLIELKKNRKLREIYFGKNFTNIKTK